VQPLASAADGLDVKIAAELLERARAEGVAGRSGWLLQQVTRAVLQAALEAEMADHLGERGETPPLGSTNERNGSSAKTVRTEIGQVRLEVPRDRAGELGAPYSS
jgi:transposase-like protein